MLLCVSKVLLGVQDRDLLTTRQTIARYICVVGAASGPQVGSRWTAEGDRAVVVHICRTLVHLVDLVSIGGSVFANRTIPSDAALRTYSLKSSS